MPTNLHPKLRTTIFTILKEALEESTYSFGSLDVDKLEPAIKKIQLALPTDTRKLFADVAGDEGMAALAAQYITTRYETAMDEGFEGHLRDLSGFVASEVAEAFLQLVESLPKTYCFSVRLPAALANSFKAAEQPAYIGKKVALVGSWNAEVENYPVVEGTRTITYTSDDGNASTHIVHSLHLHIQVEGIVQEGVHTDTPLAALELMRAFLGLCLASKALHRSLFKYGTTYESIKIFDGMNASAAAVSTFNLSANDSELIKSLRVSKDAQGISEVCEHVDGVHNSENLNLAAKWYFEALSNPDDVMSFMQAVIVMEVLLGGSKGEEMGLTEMLSNRCAYMLGDSTNRRTLILEHFKKIYKTRSKIVHNGTSRLGPEERKQLKLLRGLCARVLAKEAQMHAASTHQATAAAAAASAK